MNNNMHKDEHLMRLSILDFMIRDLSLYLNVNPDDTKAIAIHNTVAADAAKLRAAYEQNHGPLCIRSQSSETRWDWISDPWPWETEANFTIK